MLKNEKGATLVELAISIGIFIIAIVNMYSAFVQLYFSRDIAQQNYQASLIAKSHLESLRYLPFTDLNLATEDKVRVNDNGEQDGSGNFYRSTTISDVTGKTKLKQAAVNVSFFINGTETEKPAHLSTLIYDES